MIIAREQYRLIAKNIWIIFKISIHFGFYIAILRVKLIFFSRFRS